MSGYFRYLRALLNARVPSSLEQSSVPPTPLAAAIRDLVMSPLQLSTQMSMEGENMLHVNQRYVCSVPLRADSIAIVPEVVNSCFALFFCVVKTSQILHFAPRKCSLHVQMLRLSGISPLIKP